ncbi:hypothetical protein Intca_1563 [Intrasporangium calvum DSM 43043]|uniref:Tetratricopeptide repeat protein n=1 Tax=Intrasporangium calvum (strain ATCC 23552 / DSM 43043 / JCM 3097 / NBRC 12989 / NCIMB 10167 / NRRL B-3866 / 7 KIP) TaxID=710696 RepID=E6S8T9_INTC7|nr:hypothetical protein Intca_1563 [Intrasporangium calvum DSM 43043]
MSDERESKDSGPTRGDGGDRPRRGPHDGRQRGRRDDRRDERPGAPRTGSADRGRYQGGDDRRSDRRDEDRPRSQSGSPVRRGPGGPSASRDAGRPQGGRGAQGARGGQRRDGQEGSGRPDLERRGGPRLTPKTPRKPEPRIREGVTGHEVDRGVKNQLRTLSKENAEGVAQHLVMVSELLDVDPSAALAHAETAVRRAGRVPAAREALGLVAYRMGDWARALTEFRTVRRLSGSSHLLPLMVDCERALGRHAKALELAQSDEAANLAIDDRVELAIVTSGLRRDLGQLDAAIAGLSDLVRRLSPNRPSAARLYYAYADAKLAAGDAAGAREWFARAADADHELTTDAAERLDELDGAEVLDLSPEHDEDEELGSETPEP